MMTPTTCSHKLCARLKAETQNAHTAAERHPFHASLFRGQIPVDAVLDHHADMGLIAQALEHRLAGSNDRAILGVFRPYHIRTSCFKADLASAGRPWPTKATTAAARTFVDNLGVADVPSLLGAFYVLEGSTNGGRYIQAAIAKAYPGTLLARSVTALSPHGDQQHERWGAFRTSLDALELPAEVSDRVVDAAGRTFAAITVLMDEIMLSAQPSPRSAGLSPDVPAH